MKAGFKLLAAFALLAAAAVLSGCVSSNEGAPGSPGTSATQGQISIPLDSIGTDAKWLEFDSGGVKIRYIIVKAADGSVKTAFDACDVCYGQKKGYRQEGSFLVCNNCGKRFAISSLGTENKNPGGCWPGYLPNKISGDSVTLEKSDLEKGKWRFS